MYYGLLTQVVGAYTEHQLRAYPLRAQRTQDRAKPVPAKSARSLMSYMRAAGHLCPEGVCAVVISREQLSKLGGDSVVSTTVTIKK